jgi:hypothetical protein
MRRLWGTNRGLWFFACFQLIVLTAKIAQHDNASFAWGAALVPLFLYLAVALLLTLLDVPSGQGWQRLYPPVLVLCCGASAASFVARADGGFQHSWTATLSPTVFTLIFVIALPYIVSLFRRPVPAS